MSLVDWIYPRICVGCRREGKYICLDCQKKLVKPEQICPMCAKPSLDGWTHPRCRSKYGMERLIVGLPYRGMVQDCLKKVKYKSSWGIIEFLYELCEFPEMRGLVTSVPMWREKERERGFNQAEMIAKLLAKGLQVLALQVLERTRETKPMFGLTRKARAENIKDAFRLNPKSEILNLPDRQAGPKLIVLVDDVWTTGSTMRECAGVLKRAGVGEVWGMTLAR